MGANSTGRALVRATLAASPTADAWVTPTLALAGRGALDRGAAGRGAAGRGATAFGPATGRDTEAVFGIAANRATDSALGAGRDPALEAAAIEPSATATRPKAGALRAGEAVSAFAAGFSDDEAVSGFAAGFNDDEAVGGFAAGLSAGSDTLASVFEVAEVDGSWVALTTTEADALVRRAPGVLDPAGSLADDSRPSSLMGAWHLRQWIVVTRPRTRLFHSRSGMLNFALHALHSTLNDIGLLERGRLSTVCTNGPVADGFSEPHDPHAFSVVAH